jgi:macrodomain Ter protein organizer (MatP/YcbG family)
MKKIELANNKGIALVDDEDYYLVKDDKWHYNSGYAYCNKLGLMHRVIMKCENNKVIDHFNHDTLDNRRFNLKMVTHSENNKNKRKFNYQKQNKNSSIIIDKKVYNNFKSYCQKNGYIITKLISKLISEWLEKQKDK